MIINGDTIHGSTRLQKYGFLLSKQCRWELGKIAKKQPQLNFYDDWKPRWYEPYSKQLNEDMLKCIENKTVSQILEDKIQNKYRYFLTFKGQAVWHDICERLLSIELSSICAKIQNLQKINLETLLSTVYLTYPEFTEHRIIEDRLG